MIAQTLTGDRGVDGDQQCLVSAGGGPLDQVEAALSVLPQVELEPPGGIRCRLRDVFDRGCAHRRQRERDSSLRSCTDSGDFAFGVHHACVTGRGDAEGQSGTGPGDRRRRIRGVDSVEDAGKKLDVAQRVTVLRQCPLIQSSTVDIVERSRRSHALGDATEVPDVGCRLQPGGDPIEARQVELQQGGKLFEIRQSTFHFSPRFRSVWQSTVRFFHSRLR